MLYRFLRALTCFILKFFIKDFKVIGKENIPADHAVMFAAFHSNSFLDAIILDIVADRPIWSLARGDAFKNKWISKLLKKFYMMPIFRASEGRENMGKNDATFESCAEIFKENGQVLIFSEGLCKNQERLLPLKKGTARLALQSWQSGLDVLVIPVAVNYDQFTKIGKKVIVEFGKPIYHRDFESSELNGSNIKQFNLILKEKLDNVITRNFDIAYPLNPFYLPGLVINAPIYFILTKIIKAKTRGTVFFDSVFLGSLIFLLPIYWIILLLVLRFLAG